jgi:Flp pilus assembly secretin CpaC
LHRLFAALFFTFFNFTWSAAADQTITMAIQQSTIINLPGERCGTQTIVLSDPLITDITLLRNTNGNLVVGINGRRHGVTNVVAYDCKGIELTKKIVEVTEPEI